ncbi:MAG TPA: hypothetical protein VMC81_11320 [Rhodocyclaceae bacterium]|nr:hypothetical protein [Rhodocyclaceae bacterium]
MTTNSKGWRLDTKSHLVAGAVSAAATVLIFVAIGMLVSYYAAGPLAVSAAQLAV